ncbi:DUF5317 domain-containing protein [Bacillus salitolerans]|uniref:DUF5317 domain-containing protein n=1 Tax=Bacillus salitolerans TaxID=1437434 RepID=A0ABW4LQA4_9BACI
MVYDGIILSIIIALFRGGNFKGIAELKFKMGWVFPALLGFQLIIFYFQNKIEWVGIVSNYAFMAVYVIGLYFLWLNRHHSSFMVIFIGVLLNFIVMAVNGGRMPVSVEAASFIDPYYLEAMKEGLYAKHAMITDSTILSFLGDIIPLTAPYPREQVISIGDVIMNVGIFIFIQKLMVNKKMKENNVATSH